VPQDLIWKDGVLIGGTVKKIVVWVIDVNNDDEIRDRFLVSFPEIISAKDVWVIFEQRFHKAQKDSKKLAKTIAFFLNGSKKKSLGTSLELIMKNYIVLY